MSMQREDECEHKDYNFTVNVKENNIFMENVKAIHEQRNTYVFIHRSLETKNGINKSGSKKGNYRAEDRNLQIK